jgi:multiple sugar transport system ATP-binding protein
LAGVSYVNATCVYEGAVAPSVAELNLEIADGEFMVLVGPSGSGKSTALRMLAGLEHVTSGELRIGGVDVARTPPQQRDVAMVFQSYALYPHKTVAENLAFALKVRGVSKAEQTRRVQDAAKLLDLERYLDRKPKALSGGQRQRVAMGRAIVREPSVFLMDEPLSNLDAKLRVETRANIAALQSRLGTTTVYVTHDQVEAMTMGHRVAVLNDGQLQQVDIPRNLYDRPANAFVAEFIGSPAMNLRLARLVPGGAQLGELSVPLAPEVIAAANGAGLRDVTLGVRPEAFSAVSLNGSPQPTLQMRVKLVEELGADAFVYGTLPGDKPTAKPYVVRIAGRILPRLGDALEVAFPAGHEHAFHPETGVRLG